MKLQWQVRFWSDLNFAGWRVSVDYNFAEILF
jgi:hypothetical protein